MMKDNISKLKKASDSYILKDDYEITERILIYIQERIFANKEEIEKLIEIKKENIKFDDIENAIKDEVLKEIKYKNYKKLCINKNKFISATMLMPIGVIAVEAYDTIEVIRYFIKAIKTRNSVAISDIEYDEYSVKFFVLEIIKEALKKFNVDENLIMILSYEECFYEYFDKVIYTYNEIGEKLSKNEYEYNKENTNQKYIYIEDEDLKEIAIADNETESEILYGNIDDIINEINLSYNIAVVIYTKNSEKAYKFINLVYSKNVFVNTSLQNIDELQKSPDEMYEYKNIIFPMPRENIIIEDDISEEKSLVVVNKNIFAKIKVLLSKFFDKR